MRFQKEEWLATICPYSLVPNTTRGLWPTGTHKTIRFSRTFLNRRVISTLRSHGPTEKLIDSTTLGRFKVIVKKYTYLDRETRGTGERGSRSHCGRSTRGWGAAHRARAGF